MIYVAVDNSIPKMDASSAVYPTARLIEGSLLLAFHLPGCEASTIVRFNEVGDWTYGSPNDEGLHEHPLWGKGLRRYEFNQVQTSAGGERQWIATFHDGTLSVCAASIEVIRHQAPGKPWAALDAEFGKGVNQILDDI